MKDGGNTLEEGWKAMRVKCVLVWNSQPLTSIFGLVNSSIKKMRLHPSHSMVLLLCRTLWAITFQKQGYSSEPLLARMWVELMWLTSWPMLLNSWLQSAHLHLATNIPESVSSSPSSTSSSFSSAILSFESSETAIILLFLSTWTGRNSSGTGVVHCWIYKIFWC